MAHHYASTSFGHHHGPLVGVQSGWNLEDSLRTEVTELTRKEIKVRKERDYAVSQIDPLKQEVSRLGEMLNQEIKAHAATQEELRQVEERYTATIRTLEERLESEVSFRDNTIKSRDDEINRLQKIVQEQMQRLEEMEKSKYDEINALKEQLQRERDSKQVALNSLEHEVSSLSRQLEYAQQDAAAEQERARSRLSACEAEKARTVDEFNRKLIKMEQQHRKAMDQLEEQMAKEREAATERIKQVESNFRELEAEVKRLKAEHELQCEEYESRLAKMWNDLDAERIARRHAEDRIPPLQQDLAALKIDLGKYKQETARLEQKCRIWEQAIEGMHADMHKGIEDAQQLDKKLEVTSDLPAVYQVHALEPLVQVKVRECYQMMYNLYQELQHSLHARFPLTK